MTPESYSLYIERLKSIRETLTEPNKIKFIDDIMSALQYKDRVIDANHRYIRMMSEANRKSIQDYFDVKLKLEGCALRWGIPACEIESWLRMRPDVVIREVKFWVEFEKDIPDKIIKVQTEKSKPIRIARKPILKWSNGKPVNNFAL